MSESIELAKLAGATLKKLERIKSDTVSGDDPTTDQIVVMLEAFGRVTEMTEERLAEAAKQQRGPG